MKDVMVDGLRALIIAGSTRVKSNSLLLAKKAASLLTDKGVKTEIIELRKYHISDCAGCRRCIEINRCCIHDDMSMKIIPCLLKSHILIISSPVYFDNVSSLVKRFMDRTWCIRGFLRNKVLGAIVVGRGYGLDMAIAAIYNWGLKHEMIICHRGVRAHAYNYAEVMDDKRALKDLSNMCSRLFEISSMLHSNTQD